MVNFGTKVFLIISDPDMLQDLFVAKNAHCDKTGVLQELLASFLGNSFLFAKGDDVCKAKRKACAHAFYKERLEHMVEILKDKMTEACSR